jgi:hypothetical protein
MSKEQVVIPPTEKGMRCAEGLANIAMKRLEQARDAGAGIITDTFPVAEFEDEKAMTNDKYTAIYTTPDGGRHKIVYDYRSKVIERES